MLLLKFDLVQTIAFACFLYVLGLYIYNYFRLESTSINVPPVIVGGIVFVIIRLLLKEKINFEFDFTFFEPSSTIFFTMIGFGITVNFFRHTRKEVFCLLLSATGLVILQNITAYFLGKALGLPTLISFMTGSVALTGGAGTASSIAKILEPATKVNGLMEVGIAFSSLGILFASLMGTTFCTRIIKKKNLCDVNPKNIAPQNTKAPHNLFSDMEHREVTLEGILMTIFQICFIAGVSITLSDFLEARQFIVPSIVIAMVLAVCFRGLFDSIFQSYVSPRLLRFFADINLMILLALSMMSINLQYLLSLSFPLIIMFGVQLLFTLAWCYFVTFRLLGGNYKGALAMAGHFGFGLGAAENALVNIENLSIEYEPNHQVAFATIVVGAFLIDIINVSLLYLFFCLIY